MQSLETWFWLLEGCTEKGKQNQILNEIRKKDDKAATELERMLELAEEAVDFMTFRRDKKKFHQD